MKKMRKIVQKDIEEFFEFSRGNNPKRSAVTNQIEYFIGEQDKFKDMLQAEENREEENWDQTQSVDSVRIQMAYEKLGHIMHPSYHVNCIPKDDEVKSLQNSGFQEICEEISGFRAVRYIKEKPYTCFVELQRDQSSGKMVLNNTLVRSGLFKNIAIIDSDLKVERDNMKDNNRRIRCSTLDGTFVVNDLVQRIEVLFNINATGPGEEDFWIIKREMESDSDEVHDLWIDFRTQVMALSVVNSLDQSTLNGKLLNLAFSAKKRRQ